MFKSLIRLSLLGGASVGFIYYVKYDVFNKIA